MAKVKICGISDPETARLADVSGAHWVGCVFVTASPRAVSVAKASAVIAPLSRAHPVALLSDADDDLIMSVIALGFQILQLHGAETPARVAEIKALTQAELWKAVGVGASDDLKAAADFTAADRLLLDAKAPAGAIYQGGHGSPFDWSLLKKWTPPKPWILAGGLKPETVGAAMAQTGAEAVDVSSGVEYPHGPKGIKDPARIKAFCEAAGARASHI